MKTKTPTLNTTPVARPGAGSAPRVPARAATRNAARLVEVDPRDLQAFALLDAADAGGRVLDQYAAGRTFGSIARAHGVTASELWGWVNMREDRLREYHKARDARALTLVDEAHDLTRDLVAADPTDTGRVVTRVKFIQWDAGRSSRQYTDKTITETSSSVDVTIHLADDEVRDRLASLVGSIPGDVIDGEIIE